MQYLISARNGNRYAVVFCYSREEVRWRKCRTVKGGKIHWNAQTQLKAMVADDGAARTVIHPS